MIGLIGQKIRQKARRGKKIRETECDAYGEKTGKGYLTMGRMDTASRRDKPISASRSETVENSQHDGGGGLFSTQTT
jgi:hypothetical protein